MADEQEQLSPAQFARRSGLSLSYVYSLLWSGRLVAAKQDGVWAIPVAELVRRTQSQQQAVSQ